MAVAWSFRELYRLLDAAIDPGPWWPADTDFEIGVGAILTQNTAWVNVEQAIGALRSADLLGPAGIATVELEELKERIRPAGFMNAKAQYLKNYTTWYLTNHGFTYQMSTDALRSSLLAVTGIGPETVDDMLLYIYGRAVFIWDTYARRLLTMAGYTLPKGYEATRKALSAEVLKADFTTVEQQRFHGLIVEAGKNATAIGGWERYWQQLQQQ